MEIGIWVFPMMVGRTPIIFRSTVMRSPNAGITCM